MAASVREGGTHGLPGVRAMGVLLEGGGAQVSLNVERPLELPLAEVVAAVARQATVAEAELVGLAPRRDASRVAMPALPPARTRWR